MYATIKIYVLFAAAKARCMPINFINTKSALSLTLMMFSD